MTIYEDPHGWLRSYFNRLRQHPAFPTFAPSTQFGQLVDAIAPDNATKAAEMRQWSVAAQHGLLLHLASNAEQGRTSETIEMWSVRKGDRVLTCRAKHLPDGAVDLQLFEGDDFRRTQLCRIAPDARTLAGTWLAALDASGWNSAKPNAE